VCFLSIGPELDQNILLQGFRISKQLIHPLTELDRKPFAACLRVPSASVRLGVVFALCDRPVFCSIDRLKPMQSEAEKITGIPERFSAQSQI
jgi:hypothetical protein